MFPDSGFAVPVSSYETPVHAPLVDPGEGPFVYVAINEDWLPYVIGSLKQLLLQSTWIEQDTDTLNLTQMQAFRILQMFSFAQNNPTGFLPDCPTPIEESEYEMSICEQLRFQNGKLQALCCGHWTDIDGQPSQGIATPQPGTGSPLPAPGGGCQRYQATLQGNDQWLCPALVNTGDTIQITAINGAWTDGSGQWFCPDGHVFFGGLCTVGSGVDGTDPLPASPHMGLLTKIDGSYHFIGDSVLFAVPSGVTNKLLIFQANSANIADNSGQITFEVEVCNNQAATWTKTWPFALSDFSWTAENGSTSGHYGDWIAGTGWHSSDGVEPGPETVRSATIDLPAVTAFHLLSAALTFNITKGPFASSLEQSIRVVAVQGSSSTDAIQILNPLVSDGDGQSVSDSVDLSGVTGLIVVVTCSTATSGGVSGSSDILTLTITGDGPEPVWP